MFAVTGDQFVLGLMVRDQADLGVPRYQRVECKCSSIPVVVGVEGDEDDLDNGEENEAVDDEGEHAEDVVRVPDAIVEGGRVDVQWRRPYVAVKDAHALERQPQRPPPAILQTRHAAGV